MENQKEELIYQAPAPHLPEKLPFSYYELLATDPEIMKLLLEATKEFGEYRGNLINIMNPMLLISPLISQEAVLSSKLEGTHATLEDLLNFDANVKSNIDQDELKEIANYRNALFYALENVSTIHSNDNKLPLVGRAIKEMHKILLDNVRGKTKNPGNYKRQQNYIRTINGEIFTPVPVNAVDEYIQNLEKYIHYDDFDLLIQTAIIHCQFEMIHPFEDGNGRIGRLLIPLFLYYKEALPVPTFYMSSYFNRSRDIYLESLSEVSSNNNWAKWFKYFLQGVMYASKEGTHKASMINSLYKTYKEDDIAKLNSAHGIAILDFIFERPVFKAGDLISGAKISKKAAYDALKKLTESGCLTYNENTQRNRIYYCAKLVKIISYS